MCGDLRTLIDPAGNKTTWQRDAQGRVVDKIYDDGSKISYQYEPLSGRLSSVTYPNDQGSGNPTYALNYFLDDQLAGKDYTDAATADVSYSYEDVALGRLAAITDGIGQHLYDYVPFDGATNGAGELLEVNGPWADDTLRYGYDFQSRLALREVQDDTGAVVQSDA